MLTNEWQTFSEIAKATGIDAKAVVEGVQREYFEGRAECRFFDRPDKKVCEWRKKHD